MKELRARLIERIKRTQDIESFRFSSVEKIDFIPGQFLQVMFDSVNPDNRQVNGVHLGL